LYSSKDQTQEHFNSPDLTLSMMNDGGHPNMFIVDKNKARSGAEENSYSYNFTALEIRFKMM
jgi:hypothetical protein